MTAPIFRKAVILGASGGFGTLFGAAFGRVEIPAVRFDLTGTPDMPPEDVTRPTPRLMEHLRDCDLLVMCLPEKSLMECYLALSAATPDHALIVDTSSVKTTVAALCKRMRPTREVLSIEPMFAPDLGFAGQDLIAVPLRPGRLSTALLALLAGEGTRITEMDAEQHDRMAAGTQVAVHAALIAYCGAFIRLGGTVPGPSTSLQRAMVRLAARVVSRDPMVYWHIQRDNPFGQAAREELGAAISRLDRLSRDGDEQGFRDLFTQCRGLFGEQLHSIAAEAATILRSVPAEGKMTS